MIAPAVLLSAPRGNGGVQRSMAGAIFTLEVLLISFGAGEAAIAALVISPCGMGRYSAGATDVNTNIALTSNASSLVFLEPPAHCLALPPFGFRRIPNARAANSRSNWQIPVFNLVKKFAATRRVIHVVSVARQQQRADSAHACGRRPR
jgi:hypothetical protein